MSGRNTVVFGTMTSAVDSSASTLEHAPTVATSSYQYSDGTPVLITGHKLHGQNYLQWRQSVCMFVCGKGKDDYLSGVVKAPSQQDASYEKCWSCLTDAQYFKKLVEEKRLYKFLLGLNETFEDVCGRILGRSPLPSFKEAFSEPRSRSSAAHHVETTADPQPFSKDQIEFLQKLFGLSTISGMPSTGHIAQDLASGKMIGNAKECNGLYLLGSSIFPNFNKVVLNVTSPPDILLWHNRLRHPNIQYMQKFIAGLTLKVYSRMKEGQAALRVEKEKNPITDSDSSICMERVGETSLSNCRVFGKWNE
ncbi:Retrovirus-related Pol polyprotein from transposon TNT 1-94 [Senna tora]|uniref:Retrovirus-related Pol polyprotein from transposon TNT 1-94 n=1 Tax=Senna tora TaxID=362788 RepID=A0A834W4R9_9FABA|nr:Retrovirus-related Pol polyprotein from transposon TNT 1-94 [Senna tora]